MEEINNKRVIRRRLARGAPVSAGYDQADYLLGQFSSFTQVNGEIEFKRLHYFGFYWGDTFRMTPRLSLSFDRRSPEPGDFKCLQLLNPSVVALAGKFSNTAGELLPDAVAVPPVATGSAVIV